MALSAYDRNKEFDELTVVKDIGSGVVTVPTRQANARANLGLGSAAGQPTLRGGPPVLYTQGAPIAKTTAVTLLGTELLAGLITGVPGAAVAYTLPLGTAMETALLALFPDLTVNDTFDFSLINTDATGANAITLTAATGFTIVGDATVAGITAGDDSSATFAVRRTAANTYVAYRKT